jgi:hypothetical protein
MSLSLLALLPSATAAPTGYPECRTGEYVKVVHDTVHVPTRIDNAARGDVVLTAGGTEIPQRILSTLNQNYNHALLLRDVDDGGHTTFTHDTAIAIGTKTTFLGVVNGSLLNRTPPGNAIGDTADRLLNGRWRRCNDDHSLAFCFAQGARPVNLWRGSTLLLRPNPAVIGSVDLTTRAETRAAASLPYSVGAYSLYQDALDGTGVEAGNGPGTMCSGFVADALNTALDLQGSTATMPTRLYTEPARIAAANALYNAVRANAPTWTSSQVTACFAFGGDCNPSSLDWLARVAPGTGTSISPDDLLRPLSNGTPWIASSRSAQFAGGYDVNRFSHYECCSSTTGQCYRPETGAAVPLDLPYEQLSAGDGPFPPGLDAEEIDRRTTRDAWVGYVAAADGDWAETDEELCWVTDVGRLCTSLTALEADPDAGIPDLREDAMEAPENVEALAQDPTLAQPEDPPGTVRVVGATASGEPRDDIDLVRDVTVGGEGAWCAGEARVATADLSDDGAAAEVRIDGIPGDQVAVRPDVPGSFAVTVHVDAGGVSQVLSRTFAVEDCGPVERIQVRSEDDADGALTFTREGAFPDEMLVWDFGDGTSIESRGPSVRHSYALRPQEDAGSSFVVTVRSRDDGEDPGAVTSVYFANPAVTVRDLDGRLELPTVAVGRPGWSADGLSVALDVRALAEEVVFDTVTVASVPCDPTTENPTSTFGMAEVADRTIARAGRITSFALTVPVDASSPVCDWRVTLSGTGGDLPASATAMIPVAPAHTEPVLRETAMAALRARVDAAVRGPTVDDVGPVLADEVGDAYRRRFGDHPRLPDADQVVDLLDGVTGYLVDRGCQLAPIAEQAVSGVYGPDLLEGRDRDGALQDGVLDRVTRSFGATLSAGERVGAPVATSGYSRNGRLGALRDDGGFFLGRLQRTRGTRGVFVGVTGTCVPGADTAAIVDGWIR